MKDRISEIMMKEGLSATQFADKIGISASSLSHILNGRNNPSLDVVTRIHSAFPKISTDWLIYGSGNMEITPIETKNTDIFESKIDENSIFSSNGTSEIKNRKEIVVEQLQNDIKNIVRQEVKSVEKPAPKITEIRIFFDNGIYETFKPE